MKRVLRSPLVIPVLSALVLFGIFTLIELLPEEYDGAWFYALYYASHLLMTFLYFLGLHRVFRAAETRGFPRALTAAIPVLAVLSVYHFAAVFYEYYVVYFEEAQTSLLYAALAFLNDSLLSEWGLLLLSASTACLFFLRQRRLRKTAAWILSSALYLAYRLVGEIAEFLSYRSAHFDVVGDRTLLTFMLFVGADVLLTAFGFLVLFLSDRSARKAAQNQLTNDKNDQYENV